MNKLHNKTWACVKCGGMARYKWGACVACHKEYYQLHRAHRLEQEKLYRQDPIKHKRTIEYGRNWKAKKSKQDPFYTLNLSLVRLYNITFQDYEAMLIKQDFRCAICPQQHGWGRYEKLHVDHDHQCCKGSKSCGKCVRSLLCSHCNIMLGNAHDDIDILKAAIDYLQTHKMSIISN